MPNKFKLVAPYKPTGDQPQAIEALVHSLESGVRDQTLLGVTGSGKTFTIANVIERVQKPTLVISHNKTLAAQLYQEFKEFFPENAVHYFVSYYDYYQPEAYIPRSDTYIEKDSKINDTIDALRHASTADLLSRNDVIIVASVSCIYGIGDPEEYEKMALDIKLAQKLSSRDLARKLVLLQYVRNPIDPRQGNFRLREDAVEIHLPSGAEVVLVEFRRAKIISIKKRKSEFNSNFSNFSTLRIFPAKHFVTPRHKLLLAIERIKDELREQMEKFKKEGKVLELERIKQRTTFDIEMLKQTGIVSGIENYSRHLSFRDAGDPPYTLLDYFARASQQGAPAAPKKSLHYDTLEYPSGVDFLTVIDESHVSLPQIRGMYNGDRARKTTLVDYGFRLPSALDNRPLKFDEFRQKTGQTIYVSATPAAYEQSVSAGHLAEQVIRPTGLLDPELEVRPTEHQIRDLVKELEKRKAKNERSLVIALTKRLAEDIAQYLADAGLKTTYLHSEVKTLERPDILADLRRGEYDVLVGINLLREGLDLPEVSFVAILDADKEGFLRNDTTLLQIIGRTARHPDGRVVLYADRVTDSMKRAIGETNRRRKIQAAYNQEHGITPTGIEKAIRASLSEEAARREEAEIKLEGQAKKMREALTREMKKAAKDMNFELAARIRDRIKKLGG
ncbi:MAG: excinuclease ABC subunit UvrB [Candidatus Sungbacteria bacterium]|uniref:UvrABC system protein B n=1 Tax=Candidatus Sungiibacteriota bacterium TaxID=2750080 RepID=A0A9D6LRH5_9BACT|nr:excinuclease ABC subunit UvrB [Candidatus Sungbacteria bacterium]